MTKNDERIFSFLKGFDIIIFLAVLLMFIKLLASVVFYKAINDNGYVWYIVEVGVELCLSALLMIYLVKHRKGSSCHYENMVHAAYCDDLTHLPNRRSLEKKFKEVLANKISDSCNHFILFLDLDKFKIVNDNLGHHIGDKLLQAAAKRLTNCVREDDFVCRLGGDEFVILFSNVTEVKGADKIASKIVEVFRQPFSIDGNELHLTASIGISRFPADGDDFEVVMKKADTAMYKAKRHGKNNYQFYTEDIESFD
jgi:diguanylate cyclase (GGDEF)-like protein